MTQKERIEALEERVRRIESKLWPAAGKQHSVHTPAYKKAEAALPELTEEEAAWLTSRKMPTDSKQPMPVYMQQAHATAEDRRILYSLSKKRNIQAVWQA